MTNRLVFLGFLLPLVAFADASTPPYFATAEGIVMPTVISSAPATLQGGTLGPCRVTALTKITIYNCAVSGATLTMGTTQTFTMDFVQVTVMDKDETGKPAILYTYRGKSSMPEGAAARVLLRQKVGQTQLLGEADFLDISGRAGLVLNLK